MTYQPHDPRNTAGDSDEAVVLPAREARQGARGTNVRNVLIAGIALVVVAFAAIYFLMPTG